MIQISPTFSQSTCHFRVKISGVKKGNGKSLLYLAPSFNHSTTIYWVTSMCRALGTWEKIRVQPSWSQRSTEGKTVVNN